jgi:hypothetical protein
MAPITTALVVGIVIFVGTILSVEAGFRWGRRDIVGNTAAHEGLGAMEASAFALVGLLLGFSFAGAMSRLDQKRASTVAEANAIGTAYRRVDILPADAQPTIRQEFKRLIDARISAYEKRFEPELADRDLQAFSAAQDRIWSLTVAATAASKEAALLALPPVNEMIDVSAARAVLVRTHLPGLILGLARRRRHVERTSGWLWNGQAPWAQLVSRDCLRGAARRHRLYGAGFRSSTLRPDQHRGGVSTADPAPRRRQVGKAVSPLPNHGR